MFWMERLGGGSKRGFASVSSTSMKLYYQLVIFYKQSFMIRVTWLFMPRNIKDCISKLVMRKSTFWVYCGRAGSMIFYLWSFRILFYARWFPNSVANLNASFNHSRESSSASLYSCQSRVYESLEHFNGFHLYPILSVRLILLS